MPESRPSIPIVDDNPSVQSAMSDVLPEIGRHVNGYTALRRIRRGIPDLQRGTCSPLAVRPKCAS